MEKRVNQGYEIVQSIEVGTSEFVLGVSQYHPEQFVTWKCSGKTDYYWGHYTDSLLKATKDLCERALEEIAYLEQREQRKGTKREIQKTEQERQVWKLAQINNKAVRSLSKLMEAGFDNEKAVVNMTMDDILSLPGITVAEIGMINEIQKAVKAGKFITFLGGGEI